MSDFVSPSSQAAIAGRSAGKPAPARPRLELIQASRGMAALLVLLFHLTELSQAKLHQPFCFGLFSFGSAGVDFFFVLSGFIIFWVHRSDLGHRDRFKSFAIKRLIRVYPLYWIVTLVLLPAYFLVPGLGAGHESRWKTILHSLLLIPQEHSPILAVGWSLCYEVFFYALFGLTILLPFGMSLLIISFWIAGSIVNTVIESVFLIKSHFILQFCFSFHTLEFILGCLVAWLVVCRFRYRGAFLFILGCTLFSLAGISQSHRGLQLHPAIAYGLPAGLILMGAATLDLKQTVKPPQFLSYLGDASYSIYLTHYPCLSATLKLALVLNLSAVLGHDLTVVVLGVIALAFGCLIYSTLELPIVFALRKQLLPQPNRNSCPTG